MVLLPLTILQFGCSLLYSQVRINNDTFIYELHDLKEYQGGAHSFSFIPDICSNSNSHSVQICINNTSNYCFSNERIYLLSKENDTLNVILDSFGTATLPYNMVLKYPILCTNSIRSYYDNWRFDYEPIRIYLKLNTMDYKQGQEYILKKITVTLSRRQPKTFYRIISSVELQDDDLECLKRDIINSQQTCSAWQFVEVQSLVEI